MLKIKVHILFFIFSLSTIFCYSFSKTNIYQIDTTLYNKLNFPEKGYNLYKIDRKKAFVYFKNGAVFFHKKKDTLNFITCMLGIADLKKRQGKYNSSFDIIYKLQKQFTEKNAPNSFVDIYKKLGILYGIFGKDNLSIKHLNKALLMGKNHGYSRGLNSLYFPLAEQNIHIKNYNNAIKYLDSCYITSKSKNRLIYVDANYGIVYIRKKEFNKARIYLRDLVKIFKEKNSPFLAKIYAIKAEFKFELKEQDSAIFYYKKSLDIINSTKVHTEIKPKVLTALANLLHKNNKQESAFKYMKMAKDISDSLFNTQSNQNKELFEIKNRYQSNLIQKENQIIAQKKLLTLQKKASFRLKIIVSTLILLIIIVFFMLKQGNRIRQMLFNKKQNELTIKIRNKELTTNALKFIEKERKVNELLEIIKEQLPEKHTAIANTYKQNNEKAWDSFHLQFTQTNNQFYKRLLELHPSLTPKDLKHCALIKLKFDSKEMSHILGISLHSVHVARSRVRKKLNLKREESLSNYIALI